MIQFFLAFKFKTMAQCFKNKLINKRETLLEGKRKHIHQMLKKKKKKKKSLLQNQKAARALFPLTYLEAYNTTIQIK